MLMLNGIVGYQLIDDGTPLSIALMILSAGALFVGTGFIALDTGFGWTKYWDSSYDAPHNRHIALYVLYQLVPLIFLVAYFVLESILVLRVLGETRPMLLLGGAALSFAVGQVFNYEVSKYICDGTKGKIDGALFETLFTLISVVLVWFFWSSITEDDWPMPPPTTYSGGYNETSYDAGQYGNENMSYVAPSTQYAGTAHTTHTAHTGPSHHGTAATGPDAYVP